jgi:hypothetical protein
MCKGYYSPKIKEDYIPVFLPDRQRTKNTYDKTGESND